MPRMKGAEKVMRRLEERESERDGGMCEGTCERIKAAKARMKRSMTWGP